MRIVPPAEAVADIRSGDQVFVHGGAATPSVLLDALTQRADELRDVGIIHLHTEGPAPHLAPELAASFRHRALFIGGNARLAVNEGRADYVPIFLSDIPELFTRRRPAARRRRCSTSRRPMPMATARSAPGRRRARRVAAADSSSPSSTARCRARSATRFVHVRPTSTSPSRSTQRAASAPRPRGAARWSARSVATSPSWCRIARRCRWASAPSRTPSRSRSRDKRDLGVHTEMFSDSVLDLVEAGAVTGAAQGDPPRQDRHQPS